MLFTCVNNVSTDVNNTYVLLILKIPCICREYNYDPTLLLIRIILFLVSISSCDNGRTLFNG